MSGIGIKQLIAEYLNSKDEGSDAFRRLYRLATLEGIREFNMDITGEFRTVLISINANHTVPFPDDYLDYSMVGIVNECGEAVPLKVNPNIVHVKQGYLASQKLVIPVPKIPGAINEGDVPGSPQFWLNYYWGGDWLHLYGVGGGRATIGEFSVDNNARCFLINPGFCFDSILVEYLTNGYDCDCCDYTVPTFATTAFLAWLRWHDNMDRRKKAPVSEVEYLRIRYGVEKQKANVRLRAIRIQEFEELKRGLVKLVARA